MIYNATALCVRTNFSAAFIALGFIIFKMFFQFSGYKRYLINDLNHIYLITTKADHLSLFFKTLNFLLSVRT